MKKITFLLAVVLAIAIIFSACQNKNDKNDTAEPTQVPSETDSQTEPAFTDEPDGSEDPAQSAQPDGTDPAEATQGPEGTEDASGASAIEDDGDIIITVPDDQDSGGL